MKSEPHSSASTPHVATSGPMVGPGGRNHVGTSEPCSKYKGNTRDMATFPDVRTVSELCRNLVLDVGTLVLVA